MTPGCSVTPHPRPARDGALTSGRPARRFLGPVPRPTAHQHPPRCTAPSSRGRCPGARALRTVSSPLGGRLLPVRATWAQRAGVSHDAVSEGGRWTKGPTIFLPRTRVRTAVRYFQDRRAAETVSHPPGKRTARRLRTAGAGAWSAGVGDGTAPGQGLGAVRHRGDAGILANGLAPSIQSAPHTCRADVQRCSVRQFARAIRVRTLEGGGCRERRRKAPVPGRDGPWNRALSGSSAGLCVTGRGTRWHSPSLTGAEMSPRLVQTVGPEAAGAWAGGHLPSRFGIGRT